MFQLWLRFRPVPWICTSYGILTTLPLESIYCRMRYIYISVSVTVSSIRAHKQLRSVESRLQQPLLLEAFI